MAKANVNTASREQLVEAGVGAELADEILKLRRKGKVGPEALDELPGVGPATHAQLRNLLDFRDLAEEPTRRTAEAAAEAGRAVRRATGAAGEVQREVVHRSVEGTAELGQALVDLVQEQTRHNLVTLTALAEAVDWERFFKLQAEYLHASLERMAGLTQRYLEAGQTMMTAAADATRDQAKRAA